MQKVRNYIKNFLSIETWNLFSNSPSDTSKAQIKIKARE